MHDNVVNLHKKLHQPDKPIEILVNAENISISQEDPFIDSAQIASALGHNIVQQMSDNSTTYNGEIVMVNVAPDDNDAHKKDLCLTNSFDLLNDLENVTDGEALVEVVHASLDSTNLDVGVAKSVSATVTHSLDASLIIAPNMVLNAGLSDKNNIVVQHPMPQPITIAYTSLTSDKRPISTIVGKQTTNIHSEASLKSV